SELDQLKAQLAASQAQLAATQAALDKAKKMPWNRAPKFTWEGIGINELVRALYVLKPDKGAVNWVVCAKLDFPLNPSAVSDLCNQAARYLEVQKMTDDEKAKADEKWLKGAKEPGKLTDDQKARLTAMFASCPATATV